MKNQREAFSKYIYDTNREGSSKASSYIKALDWLSKMILVEPFGFDDCKNIWSVGSVERLHYLYLFVLKEARKKDASKWNIDGIPKSYLQNGYCSAALKIYQEFLVEYNYENAVLDVFEQCDDNEDEIVDKLDIDFKVPDFILDDMCNLQGEEAIRSVRVRVNQNVFRKIIMKNYNHACCITGLNVPEINRASHIIPWAEDETKRLDPRNGLYLSATYDAAFDKNLISLDDEYRIIVSRKITDHYTNESVRGCFFNLQGTKISLPVAFFPDKKYLAQHREKGEF